MNPSSGPYRRHLPHTVDLRYAFRNSSTQGHAGDTDRMWLVVGINFCVSVHVCATVRGCIHACRYAYRMLYDADIDVSMYNDRSLTPGRKLVS